MKKSELRQMIREEILKEQTVFDIDIMDTWLRRFLGYMGGISSLQQKKLFRFIIKTRPDITEDEFKNI